MTDELARRAKDAAPAAPSGEHLGEAALVALRARGESAALADRDEDADAYRHLASCAACRARMASLAKGADEAAAVQRLVDVERGDETKATGKVIPLKRRSLGAPLAMLAAAAVLIFAVTALVRRSSEGLEVRTRSYAGTMGSAEDAANVAPGDKNVEIYFESKDPVAARLIVLDEKGNKLAPARAFTREGTKMRVVVAPRTFAAHEGKAQGFVVAGTEAIVAATAEEAMALPQLTEKRLETIAKRQGAWFARVDL